jgi:hypothetical protein
MSTTMTLGLLLLATSVLLIRSIRSTRLSAADRLSLACCSIGAMSLAVYEHAGGGDEAAPILLFSGVAFIAGGTLVSIVDVARRLLRRSAERQR